MVIFSPAGRYDEWQKTYSEWKEENPDKASLLQDAVDKKIPSVDELMAAIPEFDQDTDIATRIAGQMVLQVCVSVCACVVVLKPVRACIFLVCFCFIGRLCVVSRVGAHT